MTALLTEQEGAVTSAQAMRAGLTRRQIRTLIESGWHHPFQGVLIQPNVPDPLRSRVRGGLLLYPRAAADAVTSARLHRLWGLPIWRESEQLELIFPAGMTAHRRRGMRLHTGLRDEELVFVDGIPTADVERTVCELSLRLAVDDLVCLIDSARRTGWNVNLDMLLGSKRLHAALALSDPRSESALETHGRLLLSRAGLPPEALQYELIDDTGRSHGRFDMAWPSARLVVEFDGRAYHEDLGAVRRDRTKANATAVEGWRLLRFTWDDVMRRPAYVIALIRSALFGG